MIKIKNSDVPQGITMQDVLQLMKQHSSIRDYQAQGIPDSELREIIRSAQCAASSNFIQAYSVIAVENPATKTLLAQCTNNKHVASCATFLVCCADLLRINLAGEPYQQPVNHRLIENLLVSTIDVALFAQNIALAAESKGYGSCFIGGIRTEPTKVCDILAIPYLVYPVFGMTLGVPKATQQTKPRLPVEAVLHKEQYSSSNYSQLLKEYDATMQYYYQHRASNTKTADWSENTSRFMAQDNRPHMREFLIKQGFLAE